MPKWYGQHAFVLTIEKLLRRGKNSEGLDRLVQKQAMTWWQWCHTSSFESQIEGNAPQRAWNCGFQPSTKTRRTWRNGCRPAATHLRNTLDTEARQLKRDGSEGDLGFTIDVTAVPIHDRRPSAISSTERQTIPRASAMLQAMEGT